MNPILTRAIDAAENAVESYVSPEENYQVMFDAAFDSAKQDGLSDEDATVVAHSAASDGAADDPAGYKDLIPPYMTP